MKIIKLFLCCSFLISFYCFAQGETYGGRVVFLADTPGRPINPFTIYQRRIKYFINGAARSMKVTVNGRDYPIDMDASTREAIGEWQRLLGTELTFLPVTGRDDADLIVDVSAAPQQTLRLGKGLPKLGVSDKASLNYFQQSFQSMLNNDEYKEDMKKYLEGGATDQETIDKRLHFLARLTAKHELGHVLGFTHANLEINIRPTNSTVGQIILFENYPNPTIPIMMGGIVDYMQSLYEWRGRLVHANDIEISAQEGAALDTLYSATQNQCSCCVLSRRSQEHIEFFKKGGGLANNYVCPSFRYIPNIGPLLPIPYLLLN